MEVEALDDSAWPGKPRGEDWTKVAEILRAGKVARLVLPGRQAATVHACLARHDFPSGSLQTTTRDGFIYVRSLIHEAQP